MIRLSSNWTLILKIFIPVFWIMFFGAFLLASFITNPIEAPQVANDTFRWQASVFVLSGIVFFALTFFRLKRVDCDDESIYVSNYFKTYRYPFDSIEKITIYNHLILKAAHLRFKAKGSFGKKIIFIPYMINLKKMKDDHNINVVKYGDE